MPNLRPRESDLENRETHCELTSEIAGPNVFADGSQTPLGRIDIRALRITAALWRNKTPA